MSNIVNKFHKQILKRGPRDEMPPPPPDDERCRRNGGNQWQCRRGRAAGQTLCNYHLEYSRNYESARRKGDSKTNFSGKDEVKSGMKSSRAIKLKSTTEGTSNTKEHVAAQIIKNEISNNKEPRGREGNKVLASKEWQSYVGSDGEEKNDIDQQQISKKRKSVSLVELEKDENKEKQNIDQSGVDYKSSIQKGLNNEEKPELSKKIFKEEDPQICNQCQQSDKVAMDSMKGRFDVPCINCWLNSMDLGTETKKEENKSIFGLKLKITKLETRLLEEKHRYDMLQTKNAIYKCKRLDLKEVNAGLEMELSKLRERESHSINMLTKQFGKLASYEAMLAEFSRERNNAVLEKKESEDDLVDEKPMQI